ncbi:MAG: class I SAM-dependent methyltransferase [Myxococcota bacterium]
MDAATQRALVDLVRDFYDAIADDFDATRDHPWPGWERLATALAARVDPSRPLHVLDVGCGNARLARFLRARGHRELRYAGIDACAALVARAREAEPTGVFERRDAVLAPLPARVCGRVAFDLVAAFGFLHHVPDGAARAGKVGELARFVAPGGLLALSFFRFDRAERFARRTVDWGAAPSVAPAALERGDALLAWGDAGAVRYCHAWSDEEVANALAPLESTAFARVLDFASDGREGDLNRHVVLARAPRDAH